MPQRKGWHHYPTIENKHYMSGTADIYYDYAEYQNQRGIWLQNECETAFQKMETHFDRLQYVIYKDQKENPSEIILLNDDGLMLDWNTEIEKGLDHIVISHLWLNAPNNAYRFAHGKNLEPIGKVWWLCPDIFYWSKRRIDEWKILEA